MNFPLGVTWYSLFFSVGMLLFSFSWWRNLKGDFDPKRVSVFIWTVLLLFFLGGRAGFFLQRIEELRGEWAYWFYWWKWPGFSWLAGYWGGLLGVLIWSVWQRWRFWVLVEEGTLPFLGWSLFYFLGSLVVAGSLQSFLLVCLFLVLILLLIWLSGRYRSFAWYKSGKRGFLFLVGNIIFGLVVLAWGIVKLSFSLFYFWLPFLFLCFSGLALVYLAGGKLLKENFLFVSFLKGRRSSKNEEKKGRDKKEI